MKKVKALVVDDSPLIRSVVKRILENNGIEVVGVANDGDDAVTKAELLNPDVITMDVAMPTMNGISAVKEIMKKTPRPIIMLSALTHKSARETFEALKAGAVDFVPKPFDENLSQIERELIEKIKIATSIDAKSLRLKSFKELDLGVARGRWADTSKNLLIVMAGSTGGPTAFEQVITRLPADIPAPIVSIQHMPQGNFLGCMADRLDKLSEVKVKVAKNYEYLENGTVYFAPSGTHVILRSRIPEFLKGSKEERAKIIFSDIPPVNGVKPSADVTMISAAPIFKNNMIGVVLTGMGSDGAEGMKEIKHNGGRTIVSNEETSLIFGMPKSAIDLGVVDEVVPIYDIPTRIVKNLEKLCEVSDVYKSG